MIVCTCVGIGMLAYASCMAMGVNGLTIYAYYGFNPPVFCRFINPF